MNRLITILKILIVSIFLIIPSVQAQSVDLIIQKHIEASGGEENLNHLKGIIYDGEALMGPNKAGFTIKQLEPEYVVTTIELNSFSMHQLYDGSKGWVIQNVNGEISTQEMDAKATARIKLQGDLQGPLVNYTEKGISVTFDSFSDEYGDPLIKLLVIYSDGRPNQFYYLDIDTFLTRRTKVVEKVSDPNNGDLPSEEIVVETVMEDYRNVNGFMLPFTLITYSNGEKISELKMSSVKINPKNLSPADFQLNNYTSN